MGESEVLDRPDSEQRRHNISESADKIRVETNVKRGTGTRDQDTAESQSDRRQSPLDPARQYEGDD